MFKKLIVAMDFGETSARAAQAAATLAKAVGGEVVLIHVMTQGASDGSDNLRGGLEMKLKERCAELATEYGIKTDWGVVDGNPADELATFATRWKGDMIVAGTAGRAGVARMIIGSVTDRLIRTAPVPVLVVGPEADADGN